MFEYFDELQPLGADQAVVYASADDLLSVSDMAERLITIKRWHISGRALTIRVRAPDIPQQELIESGALTFNTKTKSWERSEATFCALTLRECVTTPKLDDGQARQMVRKNPLIIKKLVNYIWNVAPLDDDLIERAARAIAALDEEPPPPAAGGDAPGA